MAVCYGSVVHRGIKFLLECSQFLWNSNPCYKVHTLAAVPEKLWLHSMMDHSSVTHCHDGYFQ